MVYKNFAELIESNREQAVTKTVALVCAEDEHSLGAIMNAGRDGIAKPLLIAREEQLVPLLAPYEGYCDYEILPVADEAEALAAMVDAVKTGKADAVMKGLIQTGDLMKVVVSADGGLRTGSLMSHMVVLQIPTYHKLLCVTDPGLNMYPDVNQKAQIIENAVSTLTSMGFDPPKVAVLAAVDHLNPKKPETVDAVELMRRNQAGQIAGCVVEGPLSYDLVVSAEAAQIKGLQGTVSGDADVVLCPSVTTGNALVKSLVFSGSATAGGIVCGAKVPVILTSRASSTEEKYYSLVLAASMKGGKS